MRTEYNGIEITYDEGRNEWLFELRGRSRKADSLAKAKEAIDKEPAEKRTQTFPRFDAYMWKYGSELLTVTVTSLVEDDNYYREGKTFWVTSKDGKRSKERDHGLYPVNAKNTALIEQIKAKEAEIESTQEEVGKLKAKLQTATVPAEIK